MTSVVVGVHVIVYGKIYAILWCIDLLDLFVLQWMPSFGTLRREQLSGVARIVRKCYLSVDLIAEHRTVLLDIVSLTSCNAFELCDKLNLREVSQVRTSPIPWRISKVVLASSITDLFELSLDCASSRLFHLRGTRFSNARPVDVRIRIMPGIHWLFLSFLLLLFHSEQSSTLVV